MPLGDERRSEKGPDGSVFFHFQFNKMQDSPAINFEKSENLIVENLV